jgi:gluconolactonase
MLSFAWLASLSLSESLSAADEKAEKVEIQDITLEIPADWKQEAPSNKLRLAQFKVGPADGDKEAAEMVVSSFGGGGGGVDANLQRWIKQFAPEGRKVAVTTGDCPQGKYTLSDLSGTYNKPIGPPIAGKSEPVKGYRSIGVILQVADKGVYFLKLTGPEKTVKKAIAAFRSSFGGNAEKEEKYEVKQ